MNNRKNMPINDDVKKKKRDNIYWRGKIKNFEESQVNSGLKNIIYGKPLEKIKPWYVEVIKMMLLACSYAYRNAYNYDNLTATMYEKLARSLPSMEDIQDDAEFAKQKNKLEEFIANFPAEKDNSYRGGNFLTGDNKQFTEEDFENLWKIMESDIFDKYTMRFISEDWIE